MIAQTVLQLSSYENVVWAWYKLLSYYRQSEVWYDELELANFELQLDNELASLSEDLGSGKYAPKPIRPLPYPKRNADGNLEARQFFWISIRDQLAWLAYLNVIGAELDSQMPAWSYGNRLFRSTIVKESESAAPRFISGPYRNTRGHTYRPFKQSWPLYRRHVLLALKKLIRPGLKVAWEEREEQLLSAEKELGASEKLAYLRDDYWDHYSKTVYWCSFDIEKFYPSIALETVRKTILSRSEIATSIGSTFLESLTRFEIDRRGWSRSDLRSIGIPEARYLPVIPTGLIAAGFLANIAMLPVDDWAATQVKRRQIAHFRYVDDHIVVAPKFDALSRWFADYEKYLRDHLGCKIKQEKTEPKDLRLYLEKKSRKRKTAAMGSTWLDPAFPSPLMTKTLEKVSDLAHTNFDLLDSEEQRRVLNDLEHLLLARLPEEELPEKTRVTFAATLLGRFTVQAEHDSSDLLNALLENNERSQEGKYLERQLRSLRRSASSFRELRLSLTACQRRLRQLQSTIRHLRKREARRRDRLNKETTAVLLKALELHPEKLRMWERVLDFSRRSGGSATIVVDAIREIQKQHPLSATYVTARLMQVFAKQSAACLNDYFNQNVTLNRRLASAAYLSSVPLALRRIRRSMRYDYIAQSDRLLNMALTFISFLLRVNPRSSDLPPKIGVRLRAAMQPTRGLLNFAKTELEATWWLARNFFVWDHPEIKKAVLKAGLSALPPQIPASWRIWRYLELDVPERALRRVARTETLAKGVEGWVAEVLHAKPVRSVRSLRRLSGPIGRASQVITADVKGRLNLADWAKWTASEERQPFDPRLSEWTALEITIQVAEAVRGKANELRKELVSSIFNFTVPEVWTQQQVQDVTWETWRRAVAGKVEARLRRPLRDDRTIPSISDYPDLNLEFGSVRAAATILLSLLRREFRLPNQFLTTGYQGLISRAAIAHIQERPCSSRTMAIMESCLMERSIETLWWKQQDQPASRHLNEDIARDIPLIITLKEFISELRQAQKVLADYQLTVSAHQPRQLIPIYLEQYTGANWRPSSEEQDQHQQGEDIE